MNIRKMFSVSFEHTKGVSKWGTGFANLQVRFLMNSQLCSFGFQNFSENTRCWRIAVLVLLYTFEKNSVRLALVWCWVYLEYEISLLLTFQNINILEVSCNKNLPKRQAIMFCFISKFPKVFENVSESQISISEN